MGTSWDQQHQESSSNAGLLTTSNASTLASVREADGVRVLSKVVQPKTCPVGYTTSLASWATLKHGFDECTAGIHTLDPCDVPFIYTTRRSGSLYHWLLAGRMLALLQLEESARVSQEEQDGCSWGYMVVGNTGFTLVQPSPVNCSISAVSPTSSR